MEELLPYYERELVYLNTAGRELARHYPKLAAALGLGAEGSDDPHIQRLIQACALLNARTAKKLDDDYPELTDALLGSLYPHFLQGMPSCAVVRFDQDGAPRRPSGPGPVQVVPRGTEMSTPDARGAPCRFRTTSALALADMAVSRAWFEPTARVAPRMRLPPRASARISVTIDSAAPVRQLAPGLARLRLHVHGDSLLCAALLDSLFMQVLETWVEADGQDGWRRIDGPLLGLGGLDPDDALVPQPAHAHPAYRLLLEYFAFADKFHFIDIDLALLAPLLPAGTHRFTLHFLLQGLNGDAGPARILRSLGAANLLSGCAPVVNLFHQSAAPVRITHRATLYEVTPSRHEEGVEVVGIDAVQVLRSEGGKAIPIAYRPYYGMRHGEAGGQAQRYWYTRRDDAGDGRSRLRIGLTDDGGPPEGREASVASIELSCSNGAHACSIAIGAPGGDLACESARHGVPIRLLRRPSQPLHFGSGAHWRLVTQLALNHRTLADLDALRETLALYDLARSGASQRQVAGITALDTRPATAWLRSGDGAALVHGIELRMTIDEEAFAGSSIAVFAEVISRFLGLYVHLNSFTRLVLVSGQRDKELLRCAPRNGNLPLI